MGDMTPDKGVFKRKGSDVWQHRVYIPKDLRNEYGGRDALPARSLGTKDLTGANRLARQRLADYEREFAQKRASTTSASPLGASGNNSSASKQPLFPETIERLAAGYHARLLENDFSLRAATFAKASADAQAFWRGDIVPPPSDRCTFKGQPYSYWNHLREDPETPLEIGVAYVLHEQRKARLAEVQDALSLGKLALLWDEANALLAHYDHDEAARLKLIRRLMEAKISALSSIIEAEAPHFPTVQHEAKDDTENPPLSVAVVSWIAEKKTLELTVRRIEDCEA